MAKAHIKFNEDIDDYQPSDSDNEYTEKELRLLSKSRQRKEATPSDSEEEVFGIDDLNNADSDIEGLEDDDLPDVRAWGKNKHTFYSTDYVDQDYGGFDGKDAVDAEHEENEALSIQKRLTEQLADEDFSFEIFDKNLGKPATINEDNEEVVKSDLSLLSKRELRQILKKESPELFALINDCKEKLQELKSFLFPLISREKEGGVSDCEALQFVRSLYHLILNYSTNIYMYLYLKTSHVNAQKHPVLKRLYQYRQLIAQLEPIYTEIIKPQIQIIISIPPLQDVTLEMPINKSLKRVKKLKLLQNIDNKTEKRKIGVVLENPLKKKLKSQEKTTKLSSKGEEKQVSFDVSEDDEDANEEQVDVPENNEEESGSKRAITYQIAKNKGLTPHRKKEQRNPRVKHRNKFRKANIRRKGAVREVRKELNRYAGEVSGIKASVSKSIKIK